MSNVQVTLETNKGEIILELDVENAPKTVENFLKYVDADFFNGTIFHRVIPGFMVQGGGFTEEMKQLGTMSPIDNEADNGLSNLTGTIAMARTQDPNSATAQFFINHADNHFLDHTSKTTAGWGYAVFGKVLEGIEVVNEIASIPTGRFGQFTDVPKESIIIISAKRTVVK